MAVYTTINDPSAYFQTLLYTGDGSASQAQTNTGNSDLQPDWIWVKKTNDVRNTSNTDSSRGFNKRMETQTTTAESTTTTDVISAQSNGFTVGNNGSTGNNGDTYAAWQWKANGGTTASNTDGSITSTVQANTTAGFSVVTYTGNGSSGATIGHGLGATPKWFFVKSRSTTGSWIHYHIGTGSTPQNDYLNFTTSAKGTTSAAWNNTAPTTSVASLGSSAEVNGNGTTFVGYFFAEIQGYSKFGSYTGNGNADGPFIYTGFKPSWVMIRRTDSTGSWLIWDTKRTPNNVTGTVLYANDAAAEETFSSYNLDFLSNGFKIRGTDVYTNANGGNYIYMCFASSPFTTSDGVPTTAR
jgi:hypothetical protein